MLAPANCFIMVDALSAADTLKNHAFFMASVCGKKNRNRSKRRRGAGKRGAAEAGEQSRAGDGRLVPRWTERGGPPVKQPMRQGHSTSHPVGPFRRPRQAIRKAAG